MRAIPLAELIESDNHTLLLVNSPLIYMSFINQSPVSSPNLNSLILLITNYHLPITLCSSASPIPRSTPAESARRNWDKYIFHRQAHTRDRNLGM